MKFLISSLSTLLLVLAGSSFSPALADTDEEHQYSLTAGIDHSGNDLAPLDSDGRRLYVVLFDEPSIARYDGRFEGLAATSRFHTGAPRLDTSAPASRAYREFLLEQHSRRLSDIGRQLDRSVQPAYQYLNVLNGVALNLSPMEAMALLDLPGVRDVRPDRIGQIQTDVGPGHIGAPAIWDGATLGGIGTRGEGVIVGIIDSGINAGHPSFAEVDGDGYQHTNPLGAGNYLGWCANNPDFCNAKLIGAYGLNGGLNPNDTSSHGSHVAGTAAGNHHEVEFTVGNSSFDLDISGVAPRANVVAYRVCAPGCPQTASAQAVDLAIDTGVNVLNYSISGSDNPWNTIIDPAFLDAFAAGIFVSASAGNDGPGPSTAAKTGPWNAAVGASTHRRIFANTLEATGLAFDVAAVQGSGPALTDDFSGELRWAGSVMAGNVNGCNPFPAGSFDGEAALIIRGDCTFVTKVDNAVAAGAELVVVYNHVGGPPTSMGGLDGTPVSSVMVDQSDGQALVDLTGTSTVDFTITAAVSEFNDTDYENVLGGFSSRGPSQFDIMAPAFVAPGVNILAAAAASGDDPLRYVLNQGTSMSSPHAAGAGALLMSLRPDWSPAAVRSALALTARPDLLLREDGQTAADMWDQGSGLIDLDAAGRATLVMEETAENFANANPALGGDPRTLNVPHLINRQCEGGCSWTRTLSSVHSSALDYAASASNAPQGLSVSVSPSEFSVAPGDSVELTITVNLEFPDVNLGVWNFGEIEIVASDNLQGSLEPATLRMPFAVIPLGDQPAIQVSPESLSASVVQGQDALRSLQIDNLGGSQLTWSISAASDDCDQPDAPGWLFADPDQGATAGGESSAVGVRFDSDGLAAGSYQALLCVDSNDPNTPVVEIPASMEVTPAAIISVSPQTLSLLLQPGEIGQRTLEIENLGSAELSWTASTDDLPQGNGLSVLYDNGPFITSQGDGPGGSDVSLLQNSSLGMSTLGFGVQLSGDGPHNRMADNFEVNGPLPMRVEQVRLYAYQTGSDTTSTFNSVNLRILDGPPDDPDSNVVFGDMETNRYLDSEWTGAYRYSETNVGTTRPIMAIEAEVGTELPPGSYWMDWQLGGTLDSGPWQHPVTIIGEATTGTGMRLLSDGWQPLLDTGSETRQASPFQLLGPLPCAAGADVPWLSLSPEQGQTAPGSSSTVTVDIDAGEVTGPGLYEALVCIESNDEVRSVWPVPVYLNVAMDELFEDRFESSP